MKSRLVAFAALFAGLGGPLHAAPTHKVVEMRILDAPPERVWNAWRDPASIRRWWGPNGFEAPVVRPDFRVGGTTLVCMQGAGTPLMCNSWQYRRLLRDRIIQFDSRFSDEQGNPLDPSALSLPEGMPKVTLHRIRLIAMPGRRTKMIVEETGYGSAPAADLSKRGLAEVLDKFEAALR